jgi:hypothetical protein|tara:strand:+ start:11793 stop:12134 length:342 start_codon:yes stop_codon:yes gene_type:complete
MDKIKDALTKHPELLDGDGWTILSREYYLEKGLPEDAVPFDHTVTSGEGKHAITRPDGSVGDVQGIHNLTFLYHLAKHVGADENSAAMFHGRGSQACELCDSIRRKLDIPFTN